MGPNYFCQIPESVRRLITEQLPYCLICWIWSHPVLSAGQDQGSRSLFSPVIVLNTCLIQALFNIFGEVIRQSTPWYMRVCWGGGEIKGRQVIPSDLVHKHKSHEKDEMRGYLPYPLSVTFPACLSPEKHVYFTC